MAEPFLSEIRVFSFSFAPRGWALCNGQLLPISQNQGLFSLLGTAFGGDGRVNFALPDLRGRVPIHTGNNHTLGERAGEQANTLTAATMPTHSHAVNVAAGATANEQYPTTTNYWSGGGSFPGFHPAANALMDANLVSSVGGNQAHINMQPFLTLNFCIALQGIFPSPT